MRFLCLHGVGSNATVLETQLEGIIREFPLHEFHFLQGEVEVDPDQAIKDYFHGPFFSYFELCTPSQIHTSFELLNEVITEEGPFDGVFAFSHGAALAASYMLYHAKHSASTEQPFRCAVFFSASLPFDYDSEPFCIGPKSSTCSSRLTWEPCDVAATIPELLNPPYVDKWSQMTEFLQRYGSFNPPSSLIAVPTAHIYAHNDDKYSGHAAQLYDMCASWTREALVHGGGHAIPLDASGSARITECIQRILNAVE